MPTIKNKQMGKVKLSYGPKKKKIKKIKKTAAKKKVR